MRPKKPPQPIAELNDPEGFGVLAEKYFMDLAVHNASETTIQGKRGYLKYFAHWCLERSIDRPESVTHPLAERYQRHLHQHRKVDGKPLSIGSQRQRMTAVKMFYRWLVKASYLSHSPLEHIELPKMPKQLPKSVLNEQEMDLLLAQPDLQRVTGLRNRAMMETLYSTGIRRAELLNLQINDVDRGRGLVRVTKGKGQKDRIIPIGERAVYWLERYLDESRPALVVNVSESTLFISRFGQRLSEPMLTGTMRGYLRQAGIDKPGSVHIFLHSTATLMLEHGADIRHIQALLGHEDLSTTQIYTQVAITQLKAVHDKTHPAKLKKDDI